MDERNTAFDAWHSSLKHGQYLIYFSRLNELLKIEQNIFLDQSHINEIQGIDLTTENRPTLTRVE